MKLILNEEIEEEKLSTHSTIESCEEDLHIKVYDQDQEIRRLKEIIKEQSEENESYKDSLNHIIKVNIKLRKKMRKLDVANRNLLDSLNIYKHIYRYSDRAGGLMYSLKTISQVLSDYRYSCNNKLFPKIMYTLYEEDLKNSLKEFSTIKSTK